MKYLKIHKIIWFILVVLFTLLDIFYVLIISFLSFIWNLNMFPFSRYWKEIHTCEDIEYYTDDKDKHPVVHIDTTERTDNNPKETFIRRLHFWENL